MPPRISFPVPDCAGFRGAIYLTSLLAGLAGMFPAASLAQPPDAAPGASGYHFETKWKPGGENGWDYLTLDSQAHRLYVARTDCVQIIDTESGGLVHTIPGLDGGHGIALAPELERGFATSGQSNSVLMFNLTSLRSFGAPIVVGKKPDAVVYEPLTHHVYVFNGKSNDVSVIDPATAAVIATIPLGGAPEFAVSDERGSLFVNLEDKSEVLAIGAEKNTVTHHWPLAPGVGPTGLAIDLIKHRIFAGCRNGQMIVLDAQSGKRLATLPIGKGVDACAVDPSTGFAFASCGDGTLTVVQEDPAKPGEFRVMDVVKTQPGARTMAVDPRTHAVYLAAANFEPAPAPTGSEKSPHPAMVPGSFVLLKFTR